MYYWKTELDFSNWPLFSSCELENKHDPIYIALSSSINSQTTKEMRRINWEEKVAEITKVPI